MHSVGHASVIMLMIGDAFSVISKHIISHQITFIAIKPSAVVLHLHWKIVKKEKKLSWKFLLLKKALEEFFFV